MRPSFVCLPKRSESLRNLTRYCKAQIQERTREVQRLEKVLQEAGIKLSSVAPACLVPPEGRCSMLCLAPPGFVGLRMYPGDEESAGKRRSGKTGKGSKWLRSSLTESARAAARS